MSSGYKWSDSAQKTLIFCQISHGSGNQDLDQLGPLLSISQDCSQELTRLYPPLQAQLSLPSSCSCQQNSVPYSCRTKALSSKNPAAVPWQMSLSIGSSHHANMLLQSSIISLCGESNYRLYLFNRNSWNICTLRLPNSF